jgi:DNA-binding transcriptional ArsR family regulator
MLALLKASSQQRYVSSKEVENFVYSYREKNKLALSGITPSNINRQLRRIKDTGLLEKAEEGFRIREFLSLTEVFDEYFLPHVLDPMIERIRAYLSEADNLFEIGRENGEESQKNSEN